MADNVASFQIDLKDGVSAPANDAKKALADLNNQIGRDKKALQQYQAALKNLGPQTDKNISQHKQLTDRIAGLKSSLSQAQGQVVDLGGVIQSKGSKPIQGFGADLDAMRARLGTSMGPLGLAGLALAIGVVARATASAVSDMAKYAVVQADAYRSELLRLEGLTKIHSWFGRASGSATELQSSIESVSSGVAISRAEVAKYAAQLYRAGLRGANLTKALEATAITASTQGEQYASSVAAMASANGMLGGSVDALATRVKSRLGGIAARQMISLSVISEKLSESMSALFHDVQPQGLLSALKGMADQFSQSTVTGRSLKTLLSSLMVPFISGAKAATEIGTKFFQGMVIGAQNLTLGFLTIARWVKRTFGPAFSGIMTGAIDATNVGTFAVYALVAAFTALAAMGAMLAVSLLPVLATIAASVWSLVVAGATLAAPFIGAALAIGLAFTSAFLVVKRLRGLDWGEMGRFIVDGLVGGIKSRAKWVIDAIKALGKSALGAFKDVLGIRSPSIEFRSAGINIARGAEQGVRGGAGRLDRIRPPAAGQSASPMVFGGRGASRINVTTGDIVISGASDAKEVAENFAEQLYAALDAVAAQQGVVS